MKKTQSGRSMVEMLGVLAIIGMLSVGGIWGFSEAMERHKLNKSKAQISAILNAVAAHLYDNRPETDERFSLIPYYKYKTPAIFDDMPIVKSNRDPYEFLQDASGAYVSIYINKKPWNYETFVRISGDVNFSNIHSDINFGVAYCRNVLSAVQPVYKENPEKFISIYVKYPDGEAHLWIYDSSLQDFADMSVGQMVNICYDAITAGNGYFSFWIVFNNRK